MNLRLLAVITTCALAAACGSSGAVVVSGGQNGGATGVSVIVSSGGGSASAPITGHTPATMRVEVWFARRGKLWPVERSVPTTLAVVRAGIAALLRGPTRAEAAAGVTSGVPPGTQILGISLHGGVATVDLTSDFQGHGVAAERLALAQLVYTVTGYPTVHGVMLHLDGAPVTAFADGLVLPNPIGRASMKFVKLVSPITVVRPEAGASVRAPFTVSGVADVFEAGLTYELLDASGHELGSGSSSASCGTGCPGTFSFEIPELGVAHDQPGTLVISSGNASGQPGGGQTVRLPLLLVAPTDVILPAPNATLTSPAAISFRHPIAGRVSVRVYDAHFHVLGRRTVTATCFGRCATVLYTVHIPFVASGLEQGYVVVTPLHRDPNASGQVVEIPVTLNGG
jgi:hypothetical protein